MTDPLRTDRAPTAGDVPELERDARVEELLLIGLDHYFTGQYELAISVWTRVLFLDRGHARARAYIERARSASAERHREGEELLHTGLAAFNRGDIGDARRLLTSAVDRGAESEEALAALARLNRLDLAAPQLHAADPAISRQLVPVRREGLARAARPAPPSRLAWILTGGVAGLAVAATTIWLWARGADWMPMAGSASESGAIRLEHDAIPVPSAGENRLFRARVLRERGRLREALEILDGVRAGDPLRAQADQLRGTIQGELLAASRGARAGGRDGRTPRP